MGFSIQASYIILQRIDRADRANPRRGPKFPKVPDRLVKRTIRGMVGYRTKRGKRALRALKVYIGVPKEFDGKAEDIKNIKKAGKDVRGIRVGELCKMLGWKNPLGGR